MLCKLSLVSVLESKTRRLLSTARVHFVLVRTRVRTRLLVLVQHVVMYVMFAFLVELALLPEIGRNWETILEYSSTGMPWYGKSA